MAFAEAQLKKFGWKRGKGLGRNEDGSADALRVNLKFDQHGVGHANDMGFHWWNHAFNKAASNIVIEQDTTDGTVRVVAKKDDPTLVSANRPSKKATNMLYGAFVRASEPTSPDDSDSSSEKPTKETKDFSVLLPEDALFQACGGRTAHKAARHGHNLDGKLQRILDQEREFHSKKEKRELEESEGEEDVKKPKRSKREVDSEEAVNEVKAKKAKKEDKERRRKERKEKKAKSGHAEGVRKEEKRKKEKKSKK